MLALGQIMKRAETFSWASSSLKSGNESKGGSRNKDAEEEKTRRNEEDSSKEAPQPARPSFLDTSDVELPDVHDSRQR